MVPDSSPRVAIASYDPLFTRVCQRLLRSPGNAAFQYDTYRSGQELLAALQGGAAYRAVLLDNALADMDAACFCRKLQQMDEAHRPWLLIAPVRRMDELAALLQEGPGQSPRLSGLNSMLLDLQTLLRQKTAQPQPDPLDRCLNSWGLHPGIRGYEYLRYAVCLAMQSDSRLAIRKDILERVGQRYCLTSSGADCGIRRLVDYCDRLDRPAWRDFKRRREPKDQKLTTGKFIYAVKAELLWQSTRQDPSEGEPLSDERELQPV